MLAIFHGQLARAPQELHGGSAVAARAKNPDEIVTGFHAAHPGDAFSMSFSAGAALACVRPRARADAAHQRLFCALDEMYCVFVGALDNLSSLIRQYGLSSKSSNEASVVVEAYRALRDRGPYPADQVLRDLAGSFAFVLFDHASPAVFAALSADGGVALHWGIAGDGSVVMTDQSAFVKGSCGKSHAPFPTGCMYHSEGALRSFEHPMNRLRAVPRVDSDGDLCGATFVVDASAKFTSIPRFGSGANWATWYGDGDATSL